MAIGKRANASANSSIAIGNTANANITTNTTDIESGRATNGYSEILPSGSFTTVAPIAIGSTATATSSNAIAIGTVSKAAGNRAVAIGAGADASGNCGSAYGWSSEASGNRSTAIGTATNATKEYTTAIGQQANATANNATAIGSFALANGTSSVALGDRAVVNENALASIAIGLNATVGNAAGNTIVIGSSSYATGNSAIAIGTNNNVSGNNSGVLGNNNTVLQTNTFVLGNNVNTSQNNSVILGMASADRAATAEITGVIGGITYGTFAGQGSAANGVVSVGKVGAERQIINVAAGKVSSDSTDAINGSQLYATNNVLSNALNSLNTLLGGDADVVKSGNNAGNFSMSNIGGTGKNNIHEAIQSISGGSITFSADNGSPTTRTSGEELEVKGDTLITTTASEGRLNVTATMKLNNAVASAETAVQTLKTTYDNQEAQTLNKTDNSANFISGTNIQLSGSATGITVATKENVTFRNVNTTNVTVSDTISVTNGPSLTSAGINAANQKITNVSNGTNAKDAVNFSQLNATDANVTNNTQNIANNTQNIANNTQNITKNAEDIQRTKDGLNATNASVATNIQNIANNAAEIAKGWNLTTSGNATGIDTSKVAMGDLVTLDGGTNIQLTQDGQKVSIATSMTPTFTTVAATDKVTIGKDGNTTNLTSTADGLDVGGDKITNVANGTQDGDAVNLSQLNATNANVANNTQDIANNTNAIADNAQNITNNANAIKANADNIAKGIKFGNATTNNSYALGDELAVEGDTNIVSNTTAKGVALTLAKNLTGLESAVFGGNTTINGDGLTIANGPGVTINGIDAANRTITNVKAGTNGTDAVNLDQLNSTLVDSKWSLKTSQDGAAESTVGEINPNNTVVIDGKGLVKVTNTVEDASGVSRVHIGIETQAVEFADGIAKTKGNSTASGTDTGAANSNALVTAGDVMNVVNNVATALTVTGLDFAANQGDTIHKDLGQQLTIKGGLANAEAASANNIRVDSENGELVIKMAEAPTFTAVTATDKVTIGKDGNTTNLTSTADGLDVGGDKITNMAEGVISVDSKEAINGGQLFNATNATAAALGTTVDPATGALTAPAYNVYGGTANNVADAVKALQEKSPITYVDASGNPTTTPGNNTALRGADANSPVGLSNVASGLGDTELSAATGPMLSNAANVGDLQKAASTLTNTGWKLQTNDGAETTVKLGETVQVIDGANTKVSGITGKDGKYTYQIDVTGLPFSFTNEAGEALVKVGDAYYKASDIEGNGRPKTGAEAQEPAKISLADKDGMPTEMTLSNVQAGKVSADSKEAINGGQLFNATNATAAALGTTVDPATGALAAPAYNVYGGTANNVADAVKALQEKSPITYVDASGNPTTTPGNNTALRGADANSPVGLSNVASGVVAQDSLDAVNGSQLFAQGEGVKNILGGNTTYDPTSGTYVNNNIGGTGQSTIHDAIKAANDTANQGWNLTANGKDGGTVKPGDSVDLNNSDGNIVISKTGHHVAFDLNPDLNVTSVTTGDTSMNNEGIKVGDNVSLTKEGLTAGNVTVTTDGINAGGNKVTGLANGDISASSTDAVNSSQLHQVAQASRTEVKHGDNIVVTSATGANGQAVYTVATAKEVNFDKATVGSVTIDNTTNKVSGLANGDISANSTDVVNGSQLHSANQNLAEYLGGGSTVDNKGYVTAPAYNVITDPSTGGSKKADNVGDAIDGLNAAVSKPLTFVADSGADSVMKLGSTVSIKGGVSDSTNLTEGNIGIVSDGAGHLDVKLAKDVQGLNSVTTGDTKVSTEGIVISDGAAGNRVSLSKTGLNNGGNQITNVAAGRVSEDSTDAVNGGQLHQTNEAIAKIATGGAGIVQYSDADTPAVPNGGIASNDMTLIGGNANEAVTLHNVAAGKSPTDAVNVAQLNDGLGKVNNRISKLDKRVRGIGANTAAVASLPQVYMPGKSMLAASGGTYSGASAVAVGYSRASDNGKIILKATGTANSAGHYSGGIGVGYQW